jgi:hypothetical protein
VAFFKQYRPLPDPDRLPVEYVEPDLSSRPEQTKSAAAAILDPGNSDSKPLRKLDKITSKIATLGDFIDTDAVRLSLMWREIVTRLTISHRSWLLARL